MKKIVVGCGGWSFWRVDREYQSSSDQLADYATVFSFVEVNNTFYQIPRLKDVKAWRSRVPKDFQFAVKCYRQISHQNPFAINENNLQVMEKMEQICETLDAIALVIQTPATFVPNTQNLTTTENFFAHCSESRYTLVWEPRGNGWTSNPVRDGLQRILSKYNITHCTDISREKPVYSANLSYSRIFGLGEKNQWEFDDNEIEFLHEQARELPQTTYLSFHTQRQTHDAARMRSFDETGRLINTTGKSDLGSMLVAIDEYNKYPITKQELLMAHGWKVIDLKNDTRIRAKQVLMKLPDLTFQNRNQLKLRLERLFRAKGQKTLEQM